MITKRGIITNILLVLGSIGLTILGVLFKIKTLMFIPIPVVLVYFITVIFAVKYYEKEVVKLNNDTKAFQESLSLNLAEGDEIIYLNEADFKKLRKEGKLYRGKDKAPLILGDKINDHTEKSK